MATIGTVIVESSLDEEKFTAMIGALNLEPPVLIKPNWGTVECYTEADILDWTLSAIPGPKLVIESHGWARNEETLKLQKPVELTKANLRKGERWFLETSGTSKVLEKHQVEYLNLTEEVWAGRTADPALIRRAVEEKFAPLQFEELYSKVPTRLYELRGGSILSLTKLKIAFYPLGASLSIKNLFGLIPGPSRGKFHGPDHTCLNQSILDINKIYRSLFTVKGMIEALHSSGYHEIEAERTRVFPGCGRAFASQDTVALDAFVSAAAGRDPQGIGHIRLAAETFGAWDPQLCAEAVRSGPIAFENFA
jgi:uncharacterized protein (DUF362 family)